MAQHKKKSGSKLTVVRDGKSKGNPVYTGWNVSKDRGFMTLFATPMSSAQLKAKRQLNGMNSRDYGLEVVSKRSGKTYQRWAYKIHFNKTGETKQGVAFYDVAEQKLRIPNFSMVANHRGGHGGYFGQSRKPKQQTKNRY